MKRFFVAGAHVALAGLVLATTGCGGGGGDSGSSAPASVTIGTDPAVLDFGGFANGAANTVALSFGVQGATPPIWVGVQTIDPAQEPYFHRPILSTTSATTAKFDITPVAGGALSMSGGFKVTACADEACTQLLATATVPYTLNIYEVDQTALSLSMFTGEPTRDTAVSISPPPANGDLAAQVSDGGQWVTAAVRDGALHLATTPPTLYDLQPKDYLDSTVSISLARHPEVAQSIAVRTSVKSGMRPVPPVTLTLDASGAVANQWTIVQVDFEPGVAPLWHVDRALPWIDVMQPVAAGSGTFAIKVDPFWLPTVGTPPYSTMLYVQAAGMDQVDVPVTLQMPPLVPSGR